MFDLNTPDRKSRTSDRHTREARERYNAKRRQRTEDIRRAVAECETCRELVKEHGVAGVRIDTSWGTTGRIHLEPKR